MNHVATLLHELRPTLNDGVFVFATLASTQQVELSDVIALIREPEGVSVVVDEQTARRLGLGAVYRCAWITLGVNSNLHETGFTAAFSAALSDAEISCNVVAGTHHDHIFVPIDEARAAMEVLRRLQQETPDSRHFA